MKEKNNRRKRKRRRIAAWMLFMLIEIAAAAAPTALFAAVLVPMVRAKRGYEAMGGEWLIIWAVFCIGYTAIHNRICDKIFKEE